MTPWGVKALSTDVQNSTPPRGTHFSSSHERQSELVPEVELFKGELHGSFQALVRKEEQMQTSENCQRPLATCGFVAMHTEVRPTRPAFLHCSKHNLPPSSSCGVPTGEDTLSWKPGHPTVDGMIRDLEQLFI